MSPVVRTIQGIRNQVHSIFSGEKPGPSLVKQFLVHPDRSGYGRSDSGFATAAIQILSSDLYLLKLSGFGIWITLLLIHFVNGFPGNEILHGPSSQLWLISWLLFGGGFWICTTEMEWLHRLRMAMLSLQILSALYMSWLDPSDNYVGFLFVIIAWQLVLFVKQKLAFIWILAPTALLAVIRFPSRVTKYSWMAMAICFLFRCFTYLIVLCIKKEADARAEQAIVNAELRAAQEIFAERIRSFERLRISRELHDVLGHRLVALSLHLEVALNKGQMEAAEPHLRKAKLIGSELMTDIRDIVGTLRRSEGIDLSRALQQLTENLPGLKVNLSIPDKLQLQDPEQVNALLRCVQEVVTNTLKHAQASTLWIEIQISAGVVQVEAWDNGCGSRVDWTLGLGLLGMKDRFEKLGGDVRIQPKSGAGFALSAWLPLLGASVHS